MNMFLKAGMVTQPTIDIRLVFWCMSAVCCEVTGNALVLISQSFEVNYKY